MTGRIGYYFGTILGVLLFGSSQGSGYCRAFPHLNGEPIYKQSMQLS